MHRDHDVDHQDHSTLPVQPSGGGDADDCCAMPMTSRSLTGPVTGTGVVTYRVEELDCATEEQQLRAALTPVAGVRSLEFDLVGRQVRVRHELSSPTPIEAAIRELGISRRGGQVESTLRHPQQGHGGEGRRQRDRLAKSVGRVRVSRQACTC